jgi:hypothetical protein
VDGRFGVTAKRKGEAAKYTAENLEDMKEAEV